MSKKKRMASEQDGQAPLRDESMTARNVRHTASNEANSKSPNTIDLKNDQNQ